MKAAGKETIASISDVRELASGHSAPQRAEPEFTPVQGIRTWLQLIATTPCCFQDQNTLSIFCVSETVQALAPLSYLILAVTFFSK